MLVFISDKRDGIRQEIYRMNADGTDLTRLTTNGASLVPPAWSRDGTKIAFVSDRDGKDAIFVINSDGSGETRLTDPASVNRNPSWSPDGMLAFDSQPDPSASAQVDVMQADGTGPIQLTHGDAASYEPTWSPDGKSLAFTRGQTVETDHIYVMEYPRGRVRRVSTGQGGYPTWSPDGRFIAFARSEQLFVVAANGGTERKLDKLGTGIGLPAWGPGAVWKGPPMGMLPKGVTSFGRGPCGQVGVCLARFSGDVDDSGALTFKISDMDNMGGNESRHLLDVRSGGTCSLDSFSLVGPGGTLYSLPIALERRDNTYGRLHRGFPAGEYTARLTTSNCIWEYRFMLGTPHLGS